VRSYNGTAQKPISYISEGPAMSSRRGSVTHWLGRLKGLDGGLGRETTIRAALDAAEPAIGPAFAEQPGPEASVRDALGLTYLYLGDYESAIKQMKQALTFQRHD